MILDELLVALGFDYDPKEITKFKKDIDKTTSIIKSLVKGAVTAATAITGMTIASTRASDEQGKLSKEIGETVENISALQFAQQRAGGSSEDMASSLRELSKISAEAARGVGSGIEAFGILGISVNDVNGRLKPVSELMLEVSQRFQGLNKAQQIELADKLGLRGSIRLLQQGPRAIRELTQEAMALGVTTEEDAVVAEEFQDSLVDLWTIIKQVTRTLSRTLAPILKDVIRDFTDWWKLNRQLIEAKIPEWIDKLTLAFKLMNIAVAAFLAYRLATHLITLVSLLRGVTVATLAANAAALLLPVLIGAAIAAVAALAEDAKVFFEGGDSFLGSMIDKFPKWREELSTAAAVFATLADLTIMIFDGWSKIFDLFSSSTFEDIKAVFKNIPGFLGDATGLYEIGGTGLIPEASQAISNTASNFIDKLEIVVQGGADTAENIANAVFNVFQQTSEDLNTAVDQ